VLDGATDCVPLGIENAGAGTNDNLGSYHDASNLSSIGQIGEDFLMGRVKGREVSATSGAFRFETPYTAIEAWMLYSGGQKVKMVLIGFMFPDLTGNLRGC